MKPEKHDVAMQILNEEIDALANTCDAEMLQKAQEYLLKDIDDQAKTNYYWLRQINRLRQFGVDTHTDYKKTVQAVTPADICNFMKEVLSQGNRAEIVMMPAE